MSIENLIPKLTHAVGCPRSEIVLRTSWTGAPQQWCRRCGAYADLPKPTEKGASR